MTRSMPDTAGFPGFSVKGAPGHRLALWLKRFLALVLILLMQGPAMMVQEVAWAKMLVSYTREKGLALGVVETFDGNHPCEMCAKAAQLRKSEGQGEPRNSPKEKKILRFTWGEMVTAKWLVVPWDSGTDFVTALMVESSGIPGRGNDSPPLPPPELA